MTQISLPVPPNRPETPDQQTLRAQYNAFKDYLEKSLPKNEGADIAIKTLVTSFEAAWGSFEEERPEEDEQPRLPDPPKDEG